MTTRRQEIPAAAWERLNQLRMEDELLRKSVAAQVGTSIPQLFYQAETYIVNPSNVGTGILSRMIETDDTVSSSVQFKTLMALSKVGEYHHDKTEISDFVNDFLSKLRRPTWRASMEAMLSAYHYGFSVTECVFGLDAKLRKYPVRLATYHPSTLAFEVDQYGQVTENGVIQFIQQTSQVSNPNWTWSNYRYGYQVQNPFTTPTDRLLPYRIPFVYQYGLTRIPRSKVIHITNLPMFSFGSPYGKTAVRTAHLAWQLKVFFMRQLGIAGKRAATPTLWGTAPQNMNKLKVTRPDGTVAELTPTQALRDMLAQRETDDAVITGPEGAGYKLTALANEANLDGFLNVINALNVWIFRCFLLPSLVMTDGSAGSRSLGDKHFQMVDRIAENDADQFTEAVVNDLIEPVVRDNFGEQDDYGHFKRRPQNLEERERLANMFVNLGNAGWLKAHVEEDMDYVRSSLSLPDDADTSFSVTDEEGATPPAGTKVPAAKDKPEGSPKEKPEPPAGENKGEE
jgi:hypothetical protein